jgi:hypothetical protein
MQLIFYILHYINIFILNIINILHKLNIFGGLGFVNLSVNSCFIQDARPHRICVRSCGTVRVNPGGHCCIARDGDLKGRMNVHLAETPAQ